MREAKARSSVVEHLTHNEVVGGSTPPVPTLRIEYRRHTGLSASWCPICGDCICPRNPWDDTEPAIMDWGEPQWWSGRQPVCVVTHPECPLHAAASKHEDGAIAGLDG